jgi:hypothetical protein
MSDPCSTPGDAPGRVGPFAAICDQLPDGATAVRAAGFTHLRRGHAPGPDDLAADTGLDADTVTRTLTVLAGRGAAELDHHGGLVGIGGLSLVPTAHELVLDGVALHTWCAVDALGIPAALGVDATARTHCPHCGQGIEVTMIAGTPTHPAPVITWYPHAAGTNMRRSFCDAANTFCTRHHLDTWRAAHGHPPGEALTLDQVTTRGQAIWALEARCC